MILRRATLSDAAAIAELHTANWRRFYRGALSAAYLDDGIVAERNALWTSRLSAQRREQLIIVAESDSALLGFSCAFLDEDPIWGSLLDNLHVAQQHHGRGIGKALLDATRSWLRDEHGRDLMYLWVLRDNARARAFYEAQGGRVEGEDLWNPPGGSPPVPKLRMVWGRGLT